jgi:hypothetical protein
LASVFRRRTGAEIGGFLPTSAVSVKSNFFSFLRPQHHGSILLIGSFFPSSAASGHPIFVSWLLVAFSLRQLFSMSFVLISEVS